MRLFKDHVALFGFLLVSILVPWLFGAYFITREYPYVSYGLAVTWIFMGMYTILLIIGIIKYWIAMSKRDDFLSLEMNVYTMDWVAILGLTFSIPVFFMVMWIPPLNFSFMSSDSIWLSFAMSQCGFWLYGIPIFAIARCFASLYECSCKSAPGTRCINCLSISGLLQMIKFFKMNQ